MTRVSVCASRRNQITGTGNHGTWLWFRHKDVCRGRKRPFVQRWSGESTRGFRYHEVKNDGKKERAGDWADRLIGRGVGLAHHPEGDRRHRFLFLVRVDDGRFGALDREVWAESRTDVLL